MTTDISRIESPSTIVHRSRWLTNEPAEFVENGAAFRLLFELAEGLDDWEGLENVSEYAPDLDRFVPKSTVIDASKYYRESKNRKKEFEGRLEAFATMLKDRNVDRELGIEIKNPQDFDLPYIIDLVDKIEKNNAKRRSYQSFFRKCFRRIEENRVVLEGILSLVPNDIYGSMISGGFTLILAYLERHTEEREATEKFLAEVQKRLGGIQRLRDVHRQSQQVHSCVNAIIVSVFTVLERIIDRITEDWHSTHISRLKTSGMKARKYMEGTFKMKSRKGSDTAVAIVSTAPDVGTSSNRSISDALTELGSLTEDFQKEIDLATVEMIGGTNRDVKCLKRAAMWMVKNTSDSVKKGKSIEDLLNRVHNTLYLILRSDSFINNRTAQDHKEMEQSRLEDAAQSTRRLRKKSNRVASKWLSSLRSFDYDSMTDIRDCIEHIEKLDGDAKNASERIMHSEELSDWLQDEDSCVFMVNLQTPPSDLNNPLSFTSALLAMTLRSTETFPMLAFFCRHRNIESTDEKVSGPIAMINSLNGQLLEFMDKKRPESNLSGLEDRAFFSSSRKKLKHGISLLRALLSLLPAGDTVFIILDSLSYLSGDDEESNKLMRALDRIIKSQTSITIKILATDPFVDSPIRDIAQWELYVEDFPSGNDNVDADDATHRIHKGLAARRGRGDPDSEEDSEEDDSDSSDD